MNSVFNQPAAARYHSFDALRAVAMLLGVVLHAAISFMQPKFPFWPAIDNSRGLAYAVFIVWVHAFRMQTFFVMAGFFAGLVVAKRGYASFALHRCKRIVLPLCLAVVVVVPITQAVWVYGYSKQPPLTPLHVGDEVIDLSSYQVPLREFFQSGDFVREFHFFHLWFLWYLIVMYALLFAIVPVARFLNRGKWCDRLMSAAMRSSLKPLWFALPTVVLMLPMTTWSADGPLHVWPEWRIVGYYGFFFAVGWLLFRQRELLAECRHWWRTYLVAATLLFPLMLFLQARGPLAPQDHDPALHLPALVTYSLFTWLMIFGLMGLFARYFDRPQKSMRYISDSSYWVYVAHLPLVIYLQILAIDIAWPASLELAIILIIVTTVLLASYQWFVRYTWLGTMLNGKKTRPSEEKKFAEVAQNLPYR